MKLDQIFRRRGLCCLRNLRAALQVTEGAYDCVDLMHRHEHHMAWAHGVTRSDKVVVPPPLSTEVTCQEVVDDGNSETFMGLDGPGNEVLTCRLIISSGVRCLDTSNLESCCLGK